MKKIAFPLLVMGSLFAGKAVAQTAMPDNTSAHPNSGYGGGTANTSLPATTAPGGLSSKITIRGTSYNVSIGDLVIWATQAVLHSDVGAANGVAQLNATKQVTNDVNSTNVTGTNVAGSTITASTNVSTPIVTLTSGTGANATLTKSSSGTTITDVATNKPDIVNVGQLQSAGQVHANWFENAAASYSSTTGNVGGQGTVINWNIAGTGDGSTYLINVNPGTVGGFKFLDAPLNTKAISGTQLLTLSNSTGALFGVPLYAPNVISSGVVQVGANSQLQFKTSNGSTMPVYLNSDNTLLFPSGITAATVTVNGALIAKTASNFEQTLNVVGNITTQGNVVLGSTSNVTFQTGSQDSNNTTITLGWDSTNNRFLFTNGHYGDEYAFNGNLNVFGYLQNGTTNNNSYRISSSVFEGLWGLPDSFLGQGSAIAWNALTQQATNPDNVFGETDFINLHGQGDGGFTWCDGTDTTTCKANPVATLSSKGNLSIGGTYYGTGAKLTGDVTTTGKVQGVQSMSVQGQTTGNSSDLTTDGNTLSTSNCYIIPTNTAASVDFTVMAQSTDNTSQIVQTFRGVGLFHPNAGPSLTTDTVSQTYQAIGASGNWSVTPTLDATTGCLKITATTSGSLVYNWKGTVRIEAQSF